MSSPTAPTTRATATTSPTTLQPTLQPTVQPTVQPTPRPQLILIAGPYRSGTGGDPDRIAANLARLEAAAPAIHRAGHVPMIGEWVALPVLHRAAEAGTDLDGDVMYETAARLLEHCDAVLRLPGDSAGADQDVAIARRRGLPVYTDVTQIPGYVA